MTTGLWIIIAFFVALCVLVGLGLSGAIPPFSEGHPSDRAWRKTCRNPVFPPDALPTDSLIPGIWSPDLSALRADDMVRNINLRLNPFGLNVVKLICTSQEMPSCLLLELYRRDCVNRLGKIPRESLSIQPNRLRTVCLHECLTPGRPCTGSKSFAEAHDNDELADWLEVFWNDPTDAGFDRLMECASAGAPVRLRFEEWHTDFEKALGMHGTVKPELKETDTYKP